MHGCRVITICHSIASFASFTQVTITIGSDVHKRRKVEKPRRRVSSGQPDVTSTSIARPMAWQVLCGFHRSIGHALLHGHTGVVSLAAASRFLMLSKGCCCRMDVHWFLSPVGSCEVLGRCHWAEQRTLPFRGFAQRFIPPNRLQPL